MNIQLLMGALLVAASTTALPQPATPAVPGNRTATPRIDQRETKQEKRIQQGAQSGQLTPRETARLQAEQGHIQKAEARAKADGKVTPRERERIQHMQNHANRDIRREKHDGQRDVNHDGRKDRRPAEHPQGERQQAERAPGMGRK